MKPETKQMNKAEFLKLMTANPGAVEMLQELLGMAKNSGYTTGFDAGYEAGASSNVYSYDGE